MSQPKAQNDNKKPRYGVPVSRTFWALFGLYAFLTFLTALEFGLACTDDAGNFPIPSMESWAHLSLQTFAVRALFGIIGMGLVLILSWRVRHNKPLVIKLYIGFALGMGLVDATLLEHGGGAYLSQFVPQLEGTLCAARSLAFSSTPE
ncbi:MAG: hypothetical protein FJX23_07020 [Alphaproteobacteria bacterium]|nr:hypothetical protein [Alphaproteobacteria bacterium]